MTSTDVSSLRYLPDPGRPCETASRPAWPLLPGPEGSALGRLDPAADDLCGSARGTLVDGAPAPAGASGGLEGLQIPKPDPIRGPTAVGGRNGLHLMGLEPLELLAEGQVLDDESLTAVEVRRRGRRRRAG